jgi:alanyl-tRNA synthetase
MTRRLYYDDSYLKESRTTVLSLSEDRCRVVLPETVFYPSSGGQPFDRGTINGIPVTDVLDTDGQVVHVLSAPLSENTAVCQIDWSRRFDHMQQHTGQHLLSAVIVDLFGIPTVAFHMGAESSSIELGASSFDGAKIRAAEQRANEIVFSNRPVKVSYLDATQAADLRKPSEREGILRIIEIDELDRSACGGTHVARTGEIGPIALRKTEKIRSNTRLEFLCGSRAVRRARADYEQLNSIAQVFSSTLDDAAGLVTSSVARLHESEKIRQKLSAELAQARGRQIYQETAADSNGVRRYWKQIPEGSLGEEARWEAQGFVALNNAIYLATTESPAALLLSVSADAGIHAGNWLKPQLQQNGGKGGGNSQLAQGSLPDPQFLKAIAQALGFVTGLPAT